MKKLYKIGQIVRWVCCIYNICIFVLIIISEFNPFIEENAIRIIYYSAMFSWFIAIATKFIPKYNANKSDDLSADIKYH